MSCQELRESMKTLELDNADLTQKLMHVDKNLRQKFTKECETKIETLTESLKKQKEEELKQLREELTNHHQSDIEVHYTDVADKIFNNLES